MTDAPPWIALLSIGESDEGQPPPGLLPVAGSTPVERQLRQALDCGAGTVWLLAPDLPERLALAVARDDRVRRARTATELAAGLAAEGRNLLLFAPGLVIDTRLLAAMIAAPADAALLVFAGDPPPGAERLDAASHWAGLARAPAPLAAQTAAALGDWDLAATFAHAVAAAGGARIEAGRTGLYMPSMRRDVPLIWALVRHEAQGRAVTDRLIESAQKGCLDWPARFLHPPIENQLLRWLLPTRLTPNGMTVIAACVGIAAAVLFATGHLGWGLGMAILAGPLDGVDGKMARVRHQFSRWGDLEHVLDKLVEHAGWLALGGWLAGAGHGLAAWLAAGGIVLLSVSEAVKGEMFRRLAGRQLDDWSPFDRAWRLVAGRRNTCLWALVPFALAGLWFQGLLMVLGYGAISFAVAEARFLMAIADYGRGASDAVARNLHDSRYAFLPRRRGEAR